ncbi:reverse transcriptase domain-containing protein [Tanacetum coccineum]
MKEFVRRYKLECKDVKGAPKCMKISRFMHGITNPELIKRLHDKIPKSVDEMMRVTTAFLRGEVAASNRERKKSFPSWKQQEAGQKQNFKKGSFRNQQRPERKQDRFTLLTKTPKEILALDKGKFKTLPPMTTPVEKRNASKFCEFHGEVGHTTDESADRNLAIQEEVGKLVEAGIIKEVHYHEWLSNPVMVKKHDDSWRMCVDFKDLNKACPKDGYPLPEIDWKMPFGLRNAGATYQRLVDKAFHKQIGRNLEVYVDDLVIKIRTEDEIFKDIEETFKTLSKDEVSAGLMTERKAKQIPIYFVSRALRGPEINYTLMEWLVMALVHDSKRLKRYFQAHPIIVITDLPIQQVLSRPEVAGRRVLCTDGSGAGLILTNPEGMEFTYALRFRFDATNNEAEYEALIAGLRIAEQMGVKNLQANVDSRLVANQVNGTFGLPGEIISDNGRQFRDDPYKDWCEKLCIRQHFTSIKHPQTNGLVERANRSLGEGMKARLDARSKNWMEEVPHVLWAHRTMIKSSNGDTPFLLTYGTEAVVPAEIGMPTLRTSEVDLV